MVLRMKISLVLFYFFYFAIVGVYVIFLPTVLADFGYTKAQIGIIFAAAPFMRFLTPFLFKRFITLDHVAFLVSLIVTLASTILFLITIEKFWLYLASNLIFGAVIGISLPYVETIALYAVSKEQYGKIRLFGSIGFMGIALWLGKVLETPNEALYYLIFLACITALFGTSVVYFDRHITTDTAKNNHAFALRSFPWFWVSIFLMQVGFGGFYNFFTIYEVAHGFSLETVSWMWSFGVICEIVMLYLQGPLLRQNLLLVLKIATFATSVRWILLYLTPDSIYMVFVSQSLHAISFALYHTAAISYIFMIYPQKRLAQQFFLGIAFGLGGAIGALLAGQIYGESMFLIEAGITLLSLSALFAHTYKNQHDTRGLRP